MKKAVILFMACCLIVGMVAPVACPEAVKKHVVKMYIQERVILKNSLPKAATFADGILHLDIQKKIVITQEELTKYVDGPNLNEEGIDYAIDVEYTTAELEAIKKILRDMDSKKKVPTDEKFLEFYKTIMNMK